MANSSRVPQGRGGPILLLFLLVGCAPKAEPPAAKAEPAPTPVTVAVVSATPIQRTILASGTLNAADDVMLTPKVDGKVIAIHADLGDRLVPGAPLLDLDPTDYQLAALEARRALDAELARLGLTEMPDRFDVEAVPSVLLTEVTRQNADRKYKLWKNSGTSSQVEMLAAELDLKAAEANKKVAVSVAIATLAAAKLRKATLDTAEQRLRDTRLRVPAPPNGTAPGRYAVAQRMTGVGEMIRTMPTTNVFRLVIDSTLKLRAALPEKYIPEVTEGQAVDVTTDAYATAVFTGKVARITPTVDPATRTFLVEIEVPNGDGKLKAGGFARAAIRTRKEVAITVPNAALVTFAGVNKVFVIDGDKARAVPVAVGTREKEWAEVIGQLPAGAKVITSGFSQLVDGGPIRIR